MLQVPPTHPETERLLAETRAMDVLEAELAADLDFGGISTSQVQGLLLVKLRMGRSLLDKMQRTLWQMWFC